MRISDPYAAFKAGQPQKVALFDRETSIDWQDFECQLSRLVRFIESKCPQGCSLAIFLPNSLSFVLWFAAIARSGREAVVLDPAWPDDQRLAVLNALHPFAVISDADCWPDDICLWPSCPAEDDLMQDFPQLNLQVEERSEPEPFYTGFTSGSTGLPKGYRRSHVSWVKSFEASRHEFGIGPKDVVLAPGSLTHSLFLYAVMDGLFHGAAVGLMPRFNPRALIAQIRKQRATVLYCVPAQMMVLIDAAPRMAPDGFPDVRLILSSGAKWPEALAEDVRRVFPNAALAEFYGASELSFITVSRDDEPVPDTSVGRPFHGVRLMIRDMEHHPVPAGVIGRIWVDSPLAFMGYVMGEGDDFRRMSFPEGEELSIGDHGWFDENGYLFLSGREKRMLVSAGKNLYPEEVERILETLPEVFRAGVVGVDDPVRGLRLIGLVQLSFEGRLSQADLIAWCRRSLSLEKIPRKFFLVDEWPETPGGKIDFRTLQSHVEQERYEVID